MPIVPQEVFKYIERKSGRFILIFLLLLVLCVWLLVRITQADQKDLAMYFLPVGQGDSELVILPGGAKILIDGGPPTLNTVRALDKVLPEGTRTIDAVIMTHPQLDHYGGLIDVARRYQIGIFVSNGFSSGLGSFSELQSLLKAHKVPQIILHKGDAIRYASSTLLVLAPPVEIKSVADPNEAAILLELFSKNTTALFMSDATAEMEQDVAKQAGPVDVLKVSHHGSKYSSTEYFLRATSPTIAAIEVGKNTYGHPTPQTLARLKAVGAKIFRTDKDGLIMIRSDGTSITVLK